MATIRANRITYREYWTPYGNVIIPTIHMDGDCTKFDKTAVSTNFVTLLDKPITVWVSFSDNAVVTPLAAGEFSLTGVTGVFIIQLVNNAVIIKTPSGKKAGISGGVSANYPDGVFMGFMQDSGGIVFSTWALPISAGATSRIIASHATDKSFGITAIQDDYKTTSIGDYQQDAILFDELTDLWLTWGKIPLDNNPYKPGGETETGGGSGTFDGSSTPIETPEIPTLSAVSAGFVSLYNPTLSELNALSAFLWSDAFSLDTLKKLFGNPMQAILGLNIVPVNPTTSGSKTVDIGNVSTGISMNAVSSQYAELDCGTLDIKEYWGAYLDYEPFTRAEIYLPYIGTRQISTDDIMNKTVQVKYHIDILSGACIAYIICGGTTLYSFSGQCSATIPLTGSDWTNVVNGVLSISASLVGLASGAGAMAAGVLGGVASTAINQMKPTIQKSGSISGVSGLLGIQTPYMILTRPRQAVPARQNAFTGYPAFITVKLCDISGYTEVSDIHLEGVQATDEELSEINALLKSGVIL